MSLHPANGRLKTLRPNQRRGCGPHRAEPQLPAAAATGAPGWWPEKKIFTAEG